MQAGREVPGPRMHHTLAVMGDDSILLFGGKGAAGACDASVWQFTPSTGVWRRLKRSKNKGMDGPQARWGHSFTPCRASDGPAVLVLGGRDEHLVFADPYLLTIDPVGKVLWSRPDFALPEPRAFHATAYVRNRAVVVFGGMNLHTDAIPTVRKVRGGTHIMRGCSQLMFPSLV